MRRSWESSGGADAEAAQHGVDDGPDLLLDGFPDLFGGEDDGLGQPAHQVAAPDLGLDGVVQGPRRTDRHLDLLCRPFPDGDAVLPAHIGLDGGVDVEAAHPDGLQGDHAAQGDHGRLGRPAADVAHHVPQGLVNGQAGTDGGRRGLLDEAHTVGPCGPGCFFDGPALDGGNG